LERDYRSTPEVVSLANRVIGAARDRPAGSRLKLIGQRKPGPEPRFAEFDDESAEAAAVAGRVRELLDEGVSASEIAILFRVNAQSEVYEQALTEAEIPYLVRGGERFFARQEVRQAMNALRVAIPTAPPGDLPGVVRLLLAPLGLTSEPPVGGAARGRWESLLGLVELAEELAGAVDHADLTQYVAELHQRAEAQHPPTVEGVTLASLHAAKGLEWDAVFLVGVVDGTLPIQHADNDEAAVEEERRLLYVGVTRARHHLWLSWALARAGGGRRYRRRSRFLYGLVPEDHPAARVVARNRPNTSEPAKQPRCRVCGELLVGTLPVKLGRCADCPSDIDENLLARLKSWRSDQARALKVPVYVVFTDATLVAIAEQRPIDQAGLVSISGIGATKLNKFGAAVLSLVAQATAVQKAN
jgi:DNA helicase-2/ATP-dependent DNA helicase PcrA